jgi:hypothetical protein
MFCLTFKKLFIIFNIPKIHIHIHIHIQSWKKVTMRLYYATVIESKLYLTVMVRF